MPEPEPQPPPVHPLRKTASSPNQEADRPRHLITKQRSSSHDALHLGPYDVMTTREIQGLVQELAYHTDLSRKQLHELMERIESSSAPAQVDEAPELPNHIPSESSLSAGDHLNRSGADSVEAVLADFGLPTDPSALRVALSIQYGSSPSGAAVARSTSRASPAPEGDADASSSVPLSSVSRRRMSAPEVLMDHQTSSVSAASSRPLRNAATSDLSSSAKPKKLAGRSTSGFRSRMAVRLQISNFLHEPQKRVKIVTLWRHEASLLPAVQQAGGCLTASRHADQWFKRLYVAFETSLSNLLDENDSPIREVVIDFVLREAKRSAMSMRLGGGTDRRSSSPAASSLCSVTPRRSGDEGDVLPRPAQIEGLRRVVLAFADAVLKVRSSSGGSAASAAGMEAATDAFNHSQWADCLHGVSSQFEQALEDAWRNLWPGAKPPLGGLDVGGEVVSPMESLKATLAWNSANASLLFAATRGIAATAAGGRSNDTKSDPQRFWGAYLRQAIKVSKCFLQLVREMTLMVGLWTSGFGQEGEHLSDTVLRKEYRRVRHAFADMLLRRSREILEAWSAKMMSMLPGYANFLEAHRDRQFSSRLLSAAIEWWRTGHSGMLRAVCMDMVSLYWYARTTESEASGEAICAELQLEDFEAALPLLEDVVIEALDRELAIHAQAACPSELGAVDAPRCKDILSRLMSELGKHLDSEWDIAQTARSSSGGLLPPAAVFQAPDWTPNMPYDLGAPKTAFLGSEVGGRYTVTRYVNRGAMGRVWVVEDRLGLESVPLCLKTFYCECECEEMSNLTTREFKRCVLEELSQVERWLTSKTRLATSQHIVKVFRVFRDAPVVRQCKGQRIEGTFSGILMEFCDKGELTSYLWDEKRHVPRSFDEQSALFLFRQLADLLAELLSPTESMMPSFSMASMPGCMPSTRFSVQISAPALEPSVPSASMTEESQKGSDESDDQLEQDDRPGHIKYCHNDIKTENLVISGSTLKLIDFQSLTPLLRTRSGHLQRTQVEHATTVYQHRQLGAVSHDNIEDVAEATCIWAVGVILCRLLAAELSTDWVYRHGGLGSQEALLEVLPEGHCLLRQHDPAGPRSLLDRIFSPVCTPTVQELLTHPWVAGFHENGDGMQTLNLDASAGRSLEELRPRGVAPGGARVAWIPLAGHVNVEGHPPPLKAVEEMIGTAVQLSDGRFRLQGVRQRCCKRLRTAGGDAAGGDDDRASSPVSDSTEYFHEWHLVVSASDDDDMTSCMAPDEELPITPISKDPTPATTPQTGTHCHRNSGASPAGSSPSGGNAPSHLRGAMGLSPMKGRRGSMWQALRTRLVVDRFYVQVRIKEDLEGDEPSDIWWLRVKWVPPMVTGKKDTLGSFTSVHNHGSQYSTCSFVQLQQLLLEGRNAVAQRLELERAAAAKRKAGGMLKLPIMGRM